MAGKLDNLLDRKFNMLTVIARAPNKGSKPHWFCLCECKNISVMSSRNLRGLKIKSCGCWQSRNQIIKTCKHCNIKFGIKKSHDGKQGTYCSQLCMAEDYKLKMNGEGNPNYKHGKSYTKEYFNFNNDKRRMNPRQDDQSHSFNDLFDLYFEQQALCYWCFDTLTTYEVDHVIPISRGGSNCKQNIVLACRSCNRQKHNKLISEWILKPNCRNKRNEYTAGKYSEVGNGVSSSTGNILLGGSKL